MHCVKMLCLLKGTNVGPDLALFGWEGAQLPLDHLAAFAPKASHQSCSVDGLLWIFPPSLPCSPSLSPALYLLDRNSQGGTRPNWANLFWPLGSRMVIQAFKSAFTKVHRADILQKGRKTDFLFCNFVFPESGGKAADEQMLHMWAECSLPVLCLQCRSKKYFLMFLVQKASIFLVPEFWYL